jgi:hypothetical protein
MNKYAILIILNAPLAIYGLLNVVLAYKLKRLRPSQAFIRMLFWSFLLLGICFAKPITDFLHREDLTNSPPLSIFDVFLTTGVMISLILVARAHGRLAEIDNRFTQLHEKISIILSEKREE